MSMGPPTKCAECKGPLPPPNPRGRWRVWCSKCIADRKRKDRRESKRRMRHRTNEGRLCEGCGEPIPASAHGRWRLCGPCKVDKKRRYRRSVQGPRVKIVSCWSWQADGLTGVSCEECGLPCCRYRSQGRMCRDCAGRQIREGPREWAAARRNAAR